MSLSYVKPGVSVSEIVSPSFNTQFLDPTSICVVGPAQGYETYTEVFVLDDNHQVQLAAGYVDTSTISVVDANNVISAPFLATDNVAQRDYTIDTSLLSSTGAVKLSRTMQTTIEDGELVVVYFENNASANIGNSFTQSLALNKTTPSTPLNLTSGTVASSLRVSKAGVASSSTDYTIAGEGTASPTIVWKNTATVLRPFQTVYLDYTVNGEAYTNISVQLNNLSLVNLASNADDIVVKTASGAPSTPAALYTKGTTTDLDYIVAGSGVTTTIARSAGTTSIGVENDKLSVRVTYKATSTEYWLPTRCYSQSDVEDKYGPAYDSSGNIVNPVSFAASCVFANGANSVIVQALFSEGTPRTQPTGVVADWEDTLTNLRDVEDINVIVPIISAGGLAATDSNNLLILQAVQNHLNYMLQQQQHYVIAIAGEDSTGGSLAARDVLREHAQSLFNRTPNDSVVLVSPASFEFANPITGQTALIGGQYAAACVAGMLGRYPVQNPLTRKKVNTLTAVKDIRTESEKNADAATGLCVIESKRGLVQVRHAITVNTGTVAARELSVVRSKHYMMQSIRNTIDDQVIGNIILDAQAGFTVQLIVSNILEQMVQQGAIVSYNSIQVRRDPVDATAVQVRFSYLPAYPLNQISIQFSLSSAQGVLFTSDTTTAQQGL